MLYDVAKCFLSNVYSIHLIFWGIWNAFSSTPLKYCIVRLSWHRDKNHDLPVWTSYWCKPNVKTHDHHSPEVKFRNYFSQYALLLICYYSAVPESSFQSSHSSLSIWMSQDQRCDPLQRLHSTIDKHIRPFEIVHIRNGWTGSTK